MTQTASDLRAARALIDTPEKWIKQSFSNRCGGYCVDGAIREIAPIDKARRRRMQNAFKNAIGRHEVSDIWDWNDAKGRRHGQVMKAMDAAIALAEATP